jgi:CheY-like chemotaxis protein
MADRRRLPFRRLGRRRRQTPTPYTSDQMSALRARFAAPGIVTCPACGGRFSLGVARLRGMESARRVVCMGCGRAAVVANTRSLRVLVVHEQDAAREALQAMLSSVGHEVIETADAGVALAAYQAAPTDTVLLSATSTGRMTAADFLRRLRRDHPDACVVAIAPRPSYAGRDPLAITAGLGATRTIRLPIAPDELLRVVDETRR